MKKIYIIEFFIIVSLYNCTTNVFRKEYIYENSFKNYIKEIHQIDESDLLEKCLFVIIPLHSCTPCVKEALSGIKKISCDKLQIIFIGNPEDKEILTLTNEIRSEFCKIHWDIKEKIIQYETNIGSPTFLEYESHTFYNQNEVNNETINQLSKKYDF
jgi:hypothetical protein